MEDCCPQSRPPKCSEGKGPQQVACQPPHRSRGPWKHFQTDKMNSNSAKEPANCQVE